MLIGPKGKLIQGRETEKVGEMRKLENLSKGIILYEKSKEDSRRYRGDCPPDNYLDISDRKH